MNRFDQMTQGWRARFLVMALGALAALAMAPLYVWPVLLISIPILLRLLQPAAPKHAFVLGWCFGFGYFVVSLYWIGIAFLVEAGTYGWLLPLAVTGLPAFLALYWGTATALTVAISRLALRPYALAAALTLAEYARGHTFTGFPWNALGYAAMASDAVAQAASVIGVWGLTFFVIMAATFPVLLLSRRWLEAGSLGIICVSVWLAGEARLQLPLPADSTIQLRIVQPNIPQSDKWRFNNAAEIFRKLMTMSDSRTASAPEGAASFQAIIWPESAVPFLMDEQEGARATVARLLPDSAILLMGSLRRQADGSTADNVQIYNSLLAISGTGEVLAHADKFHLVPWGEYLPLESWLMPLGLRKLVTIPGSFVAGAGPVSLSLPGLPVFSPLICYEIIFPGRVIAAEKRPSFILNITNDGWFGQSTGPWQHFDQARLRAIEQGLPLVRAANTGISAIVDARGGVRAASGLGVVEVVDGALPTPLETTVYARAGDLPSLTLCLALLFSAYLCKVLSRKVNLLADTTKGM